jgi:hypothetical protein
VGCYIPCAASSPLPLLSSLLTKLSVHEDNDNFQKSLFYSEIAEITSIIEQPILSNSLWLIDDFAKTTSAINWEALNTTLSQVSKDAESLQKVSNRKCEHLPIVFLTCNTSIEKALEIFGKGTNIYSVTSDSFEVI